MSPYEEGIEAYKQNKTLSDNSYTVREFEDALEWEKGFLEAYVTGVKRHVD